MGWWLFAVLLGGFAVAVWRLFRSLRTWQSPPPSTPDAKEAEARLWSTRIGEQQ
jgi:hypothetical protein